LDAKYPTKEERREVCLIKINKFNDERKKINLLPLKGDLFNLDDYPHIC